MEYQIGDRVTLKTTGCSGFITKFSPANCCVWALLDCNQYEALYKKKDLEPDYKHILLAIAEGD